VVIRLLLWQVCLSVQSSRDGLAMPEDEFRAEQLALTAVSDYCRGGGGPGGPPPPPGGGAGGGGGRVKKEGGGGWW
jgi:hypothetical protein